MSSTQPVSKRIRPTSECSVRAARTIRSQRYSCTFDYGHAACLICQSPKSALGLEFTFCRYHTTTPGSSPRQLETFPYHQLTSKASLIIATMASKFIVNAAFEARLLLLLRPSRQRTVLFGTVNKLGCPIPGRPTLSPILSSRSYSDSTSTPPFPNFSGSTGGSQSSGPKHKNRLFPVAWRKILGCGAVSIVCAGSFYVLTETC
jgi:hypothetical protein